jgi:hypothetical protein
VSKFAEELVASLKQAVAHARGRRVDGMRVVRKAAVKRKRLGPSGTQRVKKSR